MSPIGEKSKIHRPGALKQQNKSFKTGRHRSQHEIKRSQKGRVANEKHGRSLKRLTISKRSDRINKLNQIRKSKLETTKQSRNVIGAIDGVPQIITLIPLSSDVNLFSVVELLIKSTDDTRSTDLTTECGARIYTSNKLRAKFCFLTPNPTNLENILDTAKISDTILYVISSTKGISMEGDYLLELIHLHCSTTPSMIYSYLSLDNNEQMSTTSTRISSIKYLEEFLQKKTSDAKLVPLNNQQDAKLLLRKLIQQKFHSIIQSCSRPYLFVQSYSYENIQNSMGTLKLTGYLRGFHLSANDLVYVPDLGTFQLEKIEELQLKRENDNSLKFSVESIYYPEKENQQSLKSTVELDPMNINDEQTWPTADEIEQAKSKSCLIKKKVPKGTSEYQSAWILSDEEEEEEDDDDDDDETGNNRQEHMSSIDPNEEEEEEEEEMDELIINKNNYDEKLDVEEDQQTLKRMKEAKLDADYPDEIDTPMDIPARIRFQKYRGLKSFRTTKWDPKENLPNDYGKIYQLKHFRSMIKQIQNEHETQIQNQDQIKSARIHRLINVYLKNVPVKKYEPGYHLTLTGLLPYEQCLSVLNLVLHRTNESEIILKSKERLIFHLGYRRFSSSPIYSQHTNGDKHKFERYFRSGQTLVATCFGPITYPPATVLAFKEYSDGRQELVATGSLLSVNPDRIILKRIVLSGHPLKIHKRSAVIRYMFFNPDDVNWFKPIELRTRWGRRGHIKESLGTHGHMKCQFDGLIKSQDTIFMNLYKRIFPKWTYQSITQNQEENQDDHQMN